MANRQNTTIPLYRLACDPVLRAFLKRSEGDRGAAFAIPAAPKPRQSGGAAATVERALELAGA